MSEVTDWISFVLASLGCFYFAAGAIGLLRLRDVYTRLHALTKADHLGLGLITAAAMVQQDSWGNVIKLAMVWVLVLFTSASVAMLTARAALQAGIAMVRKEDA